MTISTIMFDPNIENKHSDVQRINFSFDQTTDSERGIFFKYMENEFDLRNQTSCSAPHLMVARLKEFMMGRM